MHPSPLLALALVSVLGFAHAVRADDELPFPRVAGQTKQAQPEVLPAPKANAGKQFVLAQAKDEAKDAKTDAKEPAKEEPKTSPLDEVKKSIDDLKSSTDTGLSDAKLRGDSAWMLTASAFVMIMLPGLGLFYGGMVRRKNVLATMMQSMGALAVVGLW